MRRVMSRRAALSSVSFLRRIISLHRCFSSASRSRRGRFGSVLVTSWIAPVISSRFGSPASSLRISSMCFLHSSSTFLFALPHSCKSNMVVVGFVLVVILRVCLLCRACLSGSRLSSRSLVSSRFAFLSASGSGVAVMVAALLVFCLCSSGLGVPSADRWSGPGGWVVSLSSFAAPPPRSVPPGGAALLASGTCVGALGVAFPGRWSGPGAGVLHGPVVRVVSSFATPL